MPAATPAMFRDAITELAELAAASGSSVEAAHAALADTDEVHRWRYLRANVAMTSLRTWARPIDMLEGLDYWTAAAAGEFETHLVREDYTPRVQVLLNLHM